MHTHEKFVLAIQMQHRAKKFVIQTHGELVSIKSVRSRVGKFEIMWYVSNFCASHFVYAQLFKFAKFKVLKSYT